MMDSDPYNHGLPKLSHSEGKPHSFFEFWPAWVFYTPVVFYWLWLSLKFRSFSLPLIVNPSIYLSGMVGESKSDILDQFGGRARAYMLPYRCFRRADLEEDCRAVAAWLSEKAISYPCVVKPDQGCRGSGVSKIEGPESLREYLLHFPVGRRFIIQAIAPYTAEAGIFYEKKPGAAKGAITSLTLKYLPYVIGDGEKTVRELIVADPRAKKLRGIYFARQQGRLEYVPKKDVCMPLIFSGSHCRGAIFRDGNEFTTAAMLDSLEQCLDNMPDFHYGRFDVKFKDLESLQRGEDFYILELNGASSEATHIWDARASLIDVYKTLFRQYRTLFEFGALMKARREVPWSVSDLLVHWLRGLKIGKTNPEIS